MTKLIICILILLLVHLCGSMMGGHISSPKGLLKSPPSKEFNTNKKTMPSPSSSSSSSTMPTTSQKLINAVRSYGHNSLLYNFQTYNEDMKYSKSGRSRRNSHVVNASNSEHFFSNGIKIRFNYGNQLKIMLQNSKNYAKKREFLSLEMLGTIAQHSAGQGYNVLALNAAVKEEEQILMGPQIGGLEHILKIAAAMWTEIKQFNAAAVGRIQHDVIMEQLRFIGLVLAHLVLRDDPIADPETGDYVFIAQMEPSIDPIDPMVWRQIRDELDAQLNVQLAYQQKGALVEEKSVDGTILAEKELFDDLNSKKCHGTPNSAELAKWQELDEKFRLILMNRHKLLHFNLICRTFIAFGDEAPKLILLVRVLLEGSINEVQFDQFIEKGSSAELLKFIHHTPSEILSNQLQSLAKQFGF